VTFDPLVKVTKDGTTYHLHAKRGALDFQVAAGLKEITAAMIASIWTGDYEILPDGTEHWTFTE